MRWALSVPGTGDLIVRLTPILGIVLASFLVVGVALPVLPLHVHDGLGLDAFVVGIVAGSQFAASLISRIWSGGHADKRGPRHAVTAGLVAAAASGGVYLASLALLPWPALSVAVLIAGRAVLGAAESFIITGALSWALSLAGPAHAGKTMAWVGTAMYAAFAGGAPLGTLLYERYGFAAIGTATVLLPLAALALVALPAAVPTEPGQRSALGPTIRAIWAPGVGLAFSSIGFGAITAFAALLFVTRGWSPVWLPMTGFACAFMLPRIFLGHLPDRLGGARVALLSAIVRPPGSQSSGPRRAPASP